MKRILKILLISISLLLPALLLASCGAGATGSEGPKEVSSYDPYIGREASSVTGYAGMEGYEGDIMLRDTTVAEVKELMDAKETFVVLASFENCPWCNLLLPYLNDAARDAGVLIGYIDTRANPEWQNNMDIDDYDVFVEMFGEWLTEDEDGKPHLYVPDVYFIKRGKATARHDGVTPGVDDPSQGLTEEQEEQLRSDLSKEFESIK